MKDLEVYKNTDELIHALADTICEVSKEAISTRGAFNFVLSGGSSPQKLYELLASKTYKNRIDWSKTYFFFGDERFVPENDPQRNSLMANQSLFAPLAISKSHIFNIDTTGSPEESAQNYEKIITTHFKQTPVAFDFILLGLGDNAHTASLYPHTSVLDDTEATVKSVFIKEINMYRITMTAPLINQARHVAFLVFGKEKSDAVYNVLYNTEDTSDEFPAKLILPKTGKLHWFLDTNAFTFNDSNK